MPVLASFRGFTFFQAFSVFSFYFSCPLAHPLLPLLQEISNGVHVLALTMAKLAGGTWPEGHTEL